MEDNFNPRAQGQQFMIKHEVLIDALIEAFVEDPNVSAEAMVNVFGVLAAGVVIGGIKPADAERSGYTNEEITRNAINGLVHNFMQGVEGAIRSNEGHEEHYQPCHATVNECFLTILEALQKIGGPNGPAKQGAQHERPH